MPRLILANQSTAAKRRVYFDLRDATDGITAETGETGGQPQISTNGGAWTNTGIGTLSAIGNGRYYADLTQAAVATAGDVIETRYKSANTAESPGDSCQVVAFDPDDAVRLGLTALPNAAADAAGGLPISDSGGLDMDAVATNVSAILADTGTDGVIVASLAANSVTASALATDAVNEIADGVWDEATAGHVTAGTYGVAVTDILTDTAVIGAQGAGLTAIPWNAAWDAEVQSEVNDGLVAFFTSSAALVDAVWDEVIADHLTAGTVGNALNAAGSAGDPWSTSIPGAYGAGTAGYIVGNNLDAAISSRASQTSLDTVDGIVDAILVDTGTTLDGKLDAIQGATFDTATDSLEAIRNRGDAAWVTATGFSTLDAAGVRTAVGLASANLDTQLGTIVADTNELQTDWADGGRLDLIVDAILADTGTDGVAISSATMSSIAAALLDLSNGIETSITPRQALRLVLASAAGKLSGAATTTVTIRNVGDSKDRITATVDADGNRTAVTVDGT